MHATASPTFSLLFQFLATSSLLLEVAGADDLTVETTYGKVRGTVSGDFRVFRGIPYAAAPVGDLRWRPPQPHPGWDNVRDATSFGATCPQVPGGWNTINTTTIDEDCLFANVYTPSATLDNGYPVMIYIHAGEFRYGSSNDKENEFPYFSDEVVLVTFNNRIGTLGFLGSDALRSRSPDNSTGNYGIQDQRELFRWVRKNIAAFGGDPGRVTIFGESSGGTCVGLHLTNPRSHGLFDKAILESPGLSQIKTKEHAFQNYQYLLSALASKKLKGCQFKTDEKTFTKYAGTVLVRSEPIATIPGMDAEVGEAKCKKRLRCVAYATSGEKNMTMLYGELGILYDAKSQGPAMSSQYVTYVLDADPDIPNQLECLVEADAQALANISANLPFDDSFQTDGYAPVLDGVDLTETIQDALAKGTIADVPILFGTNLDEATEFMSLLPGLHCNASKSEFEDWAVLAYGSDIGEKVGGLYSDDPIKPWPLCHDRHWGHDNHASRTDDASRWHTAAMRSATDYGLTCAVRRLAQAAFKQDSSRPLFGYFFSHTPVYSANFEDMRYMGACHGCEVPFVFGDQFEIKDDEESLLAKKMGCYWLNFAEHSDPNGPCPGLSEKLPLWPAFRSKDNSSEYLLQLDVGSGLHPLSDFKSPICDEFGQLAPSGF